MPLQRRTFALLLTLGAVGCRDFEPIAEPAVTPSGPARPIAPQGAASFDVQVFGNVVNLGGNQHNSVSSPAINDRGEVVGLWDGVSMFYSPGHDVVSIGSPAGCTNTTAQALGDGGHVAGYTFCDEGRRGFRWTPSSGFELLLPPPGIFATRHSQGYAVNSAGVVAGLSTEPGQPGYNVVTRWSPGGQAEISPRPAGTFAYGVVSNPLLINSHGVIASTISYSTDGGVTMKTAAFVWNPGEPALREIFVMSGSGSIRVSGLNDNGTVVGSVGLDVFRWTPGGGLQNLGKPFPNGLNIPGVAGVANDETIAGHTSSTAQILPRAFRWRPTVGFEVLPIAAQATAMFVESIGATGIITGSTTGPNPAQDERAFRYSNARGLEDLGTFPEVGGRTTRGHDVNSRGDIAGLTFFGGPRSWTIWLATAPNRAPTAHVTTVPAAAEGSPVTFDAAGSSDPDGDPLTYTWTFGDGAIGSGPAPTHAYSDNGIFTATLTVSDGKTTTTSSTPVTILNVAPTTSISAPATVAASAPFTISAVDFTDPSPTDLASLQFLFDCGNGLTITATSNTTCTAPAFGRRAVQAMVRDKDGGFGNRGAIVTAINEINIGPNTVSLSLTGTISVYLYSTAGFDATWTNPLAVRLNVVGSGLPGAAVLMRGPVPMATTGDYNADGRPDRLYVFSRAALEAAGLTTTRTALQLEHSTGELYILAVDPTPPSITP